MACATLVIGWVEGNQSFSKSVRVGECVDGITIQPNVWYTLDPTNCYCWIARI